MMIRRLIPVVVAAAAACGPGVRLEDTRVVGRAALGDRANNPSELGAMMRDGVVNGGLLFEDVACAKQFGTPGAVPRDQNDAFARCVAGLHLKPSAREDELGDVVVLEYAPGIEVEARVVQVGGEPRLTWIGFASRRVGDPDAPTITHAALEALRSSGDRHGPLDPAVAAELGADPQHTWLKICLDAAGNMTTLDDYETTSSAASKVFIDAVTKWTFRPFVAYGAPRPSCAMVRMASPVDKTPVVETLPLPPPPSIGKPRPVVLATSKFLEGKRIRGERAIGPDDETRKVMKVRKLERLEGSFRICLDEAGNPESVLPLRSTGFVSYDQRILAGMRAWKYAPYSIDNIPVPVCTKVIFIYKQGYRPR